MRKRTEAFLRVPIVQPVFEKNASVAYAGALALVNGAQAIITHTVTVPGLVRMN